MIPQGLLDFVRDLFLNWWTGFNSLFTTLGASSAGAAVGSSVANAGHFIALFIGNVGWSALVAAFGAYCTIWLATAGIAIVARRGTSS